MPTTSTATMPTAPTAPAGTSLNDFVAAVVRRLTDRSNPPSTSITRIVRRHCAPGPTGALILPTPNIPTALADIRDLVTANLMLAARGQPLSAKAVTCAVHEARAAARQASLAAPQPSLAGWAVDIKALGWAVPRVAQVAIPDLLILVHAHTRATGAEPISDLVLRALARPHAVKIGPMTNRLVIPGHNVPAALEAVRERIRIANHLRGMRVRISAATVGRIREMERRGIEPIL